MTDSDVPEKGAFSPRYIGKCLTFSVSNSAPCRSAVAAIT